MKPLSPFQTGDPKAPIRLIPRSGSDPDLRDEVNGIVYDRLSDLYWKLEALDQEFKQLARRRDWASNMRRRAIKAEKAELIPQFLQALKDFEIGIIAAFEEAIRTGAVSNSSWWR